MSNPPIAQARWAVVVLLCRLAGGWLRPATPIVLPSEDTWEPLIEAASSQLVTPALSFALRGRADLPRRVADYLEGVLFLNRERNESILNGLASTLKALDAAGIRPVLLKGGAAIASGLYPDHAMRIIGDIDLLITPFQAEHAARLLASRGFLSFQSSEINYSTHHHLAPQHDPRAGLVIELHIRPLLNQWRQFIDIQAMIAQAYPVPFRGGSVLIPSPTHSVVHNIVHSQLSDKNYVRHRLDARQMLELVALIYRYGEEIDWPGLRRTFEANGHLATLQDTLETAEVLFDVPANVAIGRSGGNVLDRLRSEAQRSDVSWLFERFTSAVRTRPDRLLRIFNLRSWKRLLKALRQGMRAERW